MQQIHNQNSLDLSIFHRIDINLYPLFIAVYEQQSISHAAQILSISQSAASHALQRLRLHLQDALFIRSGHKMLPTAFSEQIYPNLKDALARIQSISQPAQQFDPSMLHHLKIAIHDEVESIIFPRLVQHFQQLNPKIEFSSIKLDRHTVVADLQAQQIDFFIDIQQNFGEKIQSSILIQDHFMVCSQHSSMNADIYLKSPHIGVSSRRTGILIEDIYLKRQKITRDIILRCQHYATALQMIAQQPEAILTIPKSVLGHLRVPDQLNVEVIPIEFPEMNISLYWLKDLNRIRNNYLKEETLKIFA